MVIYERGGYVEFLRKYNSFKVVIKKKLIMGILFLCFFSPTAFSPSFLFYFGDSDLTASAPANIIARPETLRRSES